MINKPVKYLIILVGIVAFLTVAAVVCYVFAFIIGSIVEYVQVHRTNDRFGLDWESPDIFQPNIFQIDYQKVYDAGVRVITFDFDYTISNDWRYCLLARIFGKHLILPESVRSLMRYIQSIGFKTAIFTNCSKRITIGAARYLHTDLYFERCNKPSPARFQEVCEAFQVHPSEILHVGDRVDRDVIAGRSYGVKTALVRISSCGDQNYFQMKMEERSDGMV